MEIADPVHVLQHVHGFLRALRSAAGGGLFAAGRTQGLLLCFASGIAHDSTSDPAARIQTGSAEYCGEVFSGDSASPISPFVLCLLLLVPVAAGAVRCPVSSLFCLLPPSSPGRGALVYPGLFLLSLFLCQGFLQSGLFLSKLL